MNRRDVVTLLGGALVSPPLAAFAQVHSVPVIGVLDPSGEASSSRAMQPFVQALHELGYDDGRNIAIEYRYADGRFERLRELAEDLVRLRVDVIVAVVTAASLAAKRATSTTPIVMVAVADPVGAGLVASLAHPGGNVTGTSGISDQLAGKALELLRDAVPDLHRAAVLWNPANAVYQTRILELTKAAAGSLGIELQVVAATNAEEIEDAFEAMKRGRAQAVDILLDPLWGLHGKRIISLVTSARLPSVGGASGYAKAGGLMSYGPRFAAMYSRAGFYVAKILKGTAAADLPVEQPTTFELFVNLNTAKALGLTIPQSILASADQVIE